MTEASLYDRLGGSFAIAAVVDHFSDAAPALSECGICRLLAEPRQELACPWVRGRWHVVRGGANRTPSLRCASSCFGGPRRPPRWAAASLSRSPARVVRE